MLLKFVSKGLTDNNPALFQIMAGRLTSEQQVIIWTDDSSVL